MIRLRKSLVILIVIMTVFFCSMCCCLCSSIALYEFLCYELVPKSPQPLELNFNYT